MANEQLAHEKRGLEAEIRVRLAAEEEQTTRMQQELAAKQSDLEKLEKTLAKEKKQ